MILQVNYQLPGTLVLGHPPISGRGDTTFRKQSIHWRNRWKNSFHTHCPLRYYSRFGMPYRLLHKHPYKPYKTRWPHRNRIGNGFADNHTWPGSSQPQPRVHLLAEHRYNPPSSERMLEHNRRLSKQQHIRCEPVHRLPKFPHGFPNSLNVLARPLADSPWTRSPYAQCMRCILMDRNLLGTGNNSQPNLAHSHIQYCYRQPGCSSAQPHRYSWQNSSCRHRH